MNRVLTDEAHIDRITSFRVIVKEYAELLGSVPSLPRESFERAVLSILARLYAAGTLMWVDYVEDEGSDSPRQLEDDDVDDSDESVVFDATAWDAETKDQVSEMHAVWSPLHEALTDYLGEHDRYSCVVDPYADDSYAPQGGSLADDLADILVDLTRQDHNYDDGKPLLASWLTTSQFWHWGTHSVSAMQALHELVTAVRDDDMSTSLEVDAG